MKNLSVFAAVVLAAVSSISRQASAQTVISTNPVGNGTNAGAQYFSRYTFTSAFTVTELGMNNRSGASRNASVYKNGTNTGFTATFADGTPLGSYAWFDITDVPVVAGDVLDIFFGNYSGIGYQLSSSSSVSGVTYNGDFAWTTSPTAASFTGTYAGINIKVGTAGGTTGGGGAVPEPGEWAAMGILGAGLTGLVLRKRRSA